MNQIRYSKQLNQKLNFYQKMARNYSIRDLIDWIEGLNRLAVTSRSEDRREAFRIIADKTEELVLGMAINQLAQGGINLPALTKFTNINFPIQTVLPLAIANGVHEITATTEEAEVIESTATVAKVIADENDWEKSIKEDVFRKIKKGNKDDVREAYFLLRRYWEHGGLKPEQIAFRFKPLLGVDPYSKMKLTISEILKHRGDWTAAEEVVRRAFPDFTTDNIDNFIMISLTETLELPSVEDIATAIIENRRNDVVKTFTTKLPELPINDLQRVINRVIVHNDVKNASILTSKTRRKEYIEKGY